MNTLKVLPLDTWMKYLDELPSARPDLKPHSVVFNRDGFYFKRRWLSSTPDCWFEVGGKAYCYEPKSFVYDLKLKNHRPLREVERKSIKILMDEHLASKQQRDLYWLDRDWFSIRDVYRMTLKGLSKP